MKHVGIATDRGYREACREAGKDLLEEFRCAGTRPWVGDLVDLFRIHNYQRTRFYLDEVGSCQSYQKQFANY